MQDRCDIQLLWAISDLDATFDTYSIADDELLCVGAADDEVMRAAADGTLTPVDQAE